MSRTLPVLRCLVLALGLSLAHFADTGASSFPNRVDLRVVAAAYRDLDGDHDAFPDTGETGRLVLTVQNFGGALTGVTLYLSSSDPGVACISTPALPVGAFAAGEIRTI